MDMVGGGTTGWYPVARAAEVGTTPVPVGAGGRSYVVVRLRPHGEVTAFPARCPHRLVPLSAGRVEDGRLVCPAHGWRFDGEGRWTEVPSLGADGCPPPRADLRGPWAVEERHGWVWVAPEPTTGRPPRPAADPRPAPDPGPPVPAGPVFDNLAPALEHAWHPVALSRELRPGGWSQVRLLGCTWNLRRGADGAVAVEPAAFGVRERLGLIWLAPAEPADVPLEVPEVGDRRFVAGWLPPLRSPGPAGPLADTFLDATHGPFVHAATIGAVDRTEVVPGEVVREPGGFSSIQEQWVDNPVDPEVATGGRPLRQRRRTTYTFRAPFRMCLRQEFLDSGAATTLLYLLQPEDLDSTRVYTCLLVSAGPGQPLPTPAWMAEQVALQRRVLAEDVRSQETLAVPGLPLDPRDEVHVPADRLGLALREALCDFTVAGRRRHRAA
ncbi:Rieske 2Fe-2S domain-containing protein [Blastococcus sp. TF02A_35]|uniref:Rieske 2Fe-2S domain-containing protein n=1 Tax=Blastococcus sp. TF02A-35 TaxID=2559612 RepID=UPI00107472DD|nr:Rieske 2Fe-2S domain-containing protein [Blastococcus sp. TF02A_35]TFV53817.1 aromatic ring-hydroxylating dioxygenase subunit alpha [Blastococcus sp. TF02A_35]